jgi:hypothetical protein
MNGIHLLGQRAKGDTAVLEIGHSGEEMRQRSEPSRSNFQSDGDEFAAGLTNQD